MTPYRRLQQRAKAAGIPANKSALELERLLGPATDSPRPLDNATTTSKLSSSAVLSNTTPDDPVCRLWPDGLAGVSSKGIFNALPDWVNAKLAPGATSQTKLLNLGTTIRNVLSLRHMFFSPNLVWFAIAIALHVFAPYDYEAARQGFSASWLLPRFALNYSVAFVYYAFFFAGLYIFKLSKRKFLPNSYPTAGNMVHNLWYWSLAIVQWTWWEAVMVRLWATGRVAYKTDTEILSDPKLLALNVFWVLATPVWRDIHFYVAHRFLHIRSIYTYVHKLHHRNADPEPFSGMTMHPIEHLYYFSNAFIPSLYATSLSPLIFLWNFIHLTIAPGAGHSGWEDHFQADQYHYVHHAKFECNYGSPVSGCVDQYMGTFREKLGESKAYTGEWTQSNDDNAAAAAAAAADNKKKSAAAKPWSPNGYLGAPASWDHGIYTAFWVSLFPLMWYATTTPSTIAASLPPKLLETVPVEIAVAFSVAIAPVPVAMVLSKLAGDRMSWRWPFQKESIVGSFGLFFILASLACILPMYHATLWSVQLASSN